MRGVAVIGNLVAHARPKREGATVAQLRIKFSFEYIEHVAPVAHQCPLSEVRTPLQQYPYANFGKSWALASS